MFLVCLLNWNELKTDNKSTYRFFRLLFSRKAYDWLRGIYGIILVSEFIFTCLPANNETRQIYSSSLKETLYMFGLKTKCARDQLLKMFLHHLIPASLVSPKLVALCALQCTLAHRARYNALTQEKMTDKAQTTTSTKATTTTATTTTCWLKYVGCNILVATCWLLLLLFLLLLSLFAWNFSCVNAF